ncbi:hypothetical protein GCM10018773_08250 [Streptomyces candidus]|nr:hypothetical protein GCM10018773_08250 [Streptomyces candidus]
MGAVSGVDNDRDPKGVSARGEGALTGPGLVWDGWDAVGPGVSEAGLVGARWRGGGGAYGWGARRMGAYRGRCGGSYGWGCCGGTYGWGVRASGRGRGVRWGRPLARPFRPRGAAPPPKGLKAGGRAASGGRRSGDEQGDGWM